MVGLPRKKAKGFSFFQSQKRSVKDRREALYDFSDLPSLVELLQRRAQSPFKKPAYTFLADGESEEISLSYAELDRQARAIAAALQGFAAKGERALLVYPPGLDYIAAFLGCLYAGVIAVPVYPPDPNRLSRTLPRLQTIAKDAQAGFALTTSPILALNEMILEQAPDLKKLQWIATDDIAEGLENQWQSPQIGPETLAFLQYTSGSTGHPKGVILSHGNLLHNEELIKNAFGQDEKSIVLGWLPPYHDMGLIGLILQPLYLGVPCILMSPLSFLEEPLRWLKAMSHYQATTSGGPNFAYDLCVRKISLEERAKLDLSHWQVAFTGAEPISSQTIENFTRYFEPCGFRREAFYPCYGLAEGTLAVSGGKKESPPIVQAFRKKHLVGCGESLGDQKILIVNPDTSLACPAGAEGEIWVCGPSVAQGYWRQPKATREVFQAHLKDTKEGPFLRTGDLGFLKKGELFLTGRIKDVIIIHGQNHYPQDIEESVQKSSPGLRPGCGAAFSVPVEGEEKLVVVQEVDRRYYERRLKQHHVDVGDRRRSDRRQTKVEPGHDPELRQAFDSEQVIGAMTQAISEEHELQPYAVVLVKPGTIPKTSSGKIQRHACKQEFLSHKLETIEEWKRSAGREEDSELPIAKDHASVEAWLKDYIAKRLGVAKDHIHAQEPISRWGLDSLGAIELAHAVELKVGAHLPLSDFLGALTLEQIVFKIVEEGQDKGRIIPKPKAGEDKVYGLSHGQEALWFLHQLSPESSAYNIAAAVRIRGAIEISALQ
ncbi:MAG TPA: non-ribosomal peptide synthetase, partial [Deltaproteobacteria bacterium]|nr:non-ribosomal peptide synthetase [Deltaproteobacteria bacterium]